MDFVCVGGPFWISVLGCRAAVLGLGFRVQQLRIEQSMRARFRV